MKHKLVSRYSDNDPWILCHDTAVSFFMTVIIALDLATGITRRDLASM